MKELISIQSQIAVAKGKRKDGAGGAYNYRTAEDILGAAKPLAAAEKCQIVLNDDIIYIECHERYVDKQAQVTEAAGRFYVKSTATITNENGESVSATAMARETYMNGRSDAAQLTGSASSYARKYALCALLAIDAGNDPDGRVGAYEGETVVELMQKAANLDQLHAVYAKHQKAIVGDMAVAMAYRKREAELTPPAAPQPKISAKPLRTPAKPVTTSKSNNLFDMEEPK